MDFSAETKQQALVAAARHCCVCHRYKGVKVEVHHIVPQADEGSDEFDNAIVLCFDCHADAGHYNVAHPRGTKFSARELRRGRDEWYRIVREHHVESSDEPDYLYCRYLICKSWEILHEISERDLSKLPLENAVLVDNPVLTFFRRVHSFYAEHYRGVQRPGGSYRNENAYIEAHPDAVVVDKSSAKNPYFDISRTPTESELRERVANSDGITGLLLDAEVPVNEISDVLTYWEYCGDKSFQEIYRLREVWGVFLAVQNITERPIRLTSIESTGRGSGLRDYRRFDDRTGERQMEIPLPSSPLAKHMTAFIPVGIVLAPLHHVPLEIVQSSKDYLSIGEAQTLERVSFLENAKHAFHVWGPIIRPTRIRLETAGLSGFQELHELDLQNLYTLDRSWEMGCCPHLFFLHGDTAKISYGGELFSEKPGMVSRNVIKIPADVNKIIIAELEQESTYIERVSHKGNTLLKDAQLTNGQTLELSVPCNSIVEISGFYTSSREPVSNPLFNAWIRNCLVGDFIAIKTRRIKSKLS